MKKLIAAGLMAAVAIPTFTASEVASAQSWRDNDRGDRHDRRGDRRDDRHDRRDDRRADRHDRRDSNWERNHRWGDNDWRSNRGQNRRLYARGNWRAPFRYQSFRPGVRINASFFGSRYVIADPWRYHLPPTDRFQQYVRHYDDLLLVDVRRGVVLRVYRNFYW